MFRNLKVLGLALLAVLAMSAVVASAASAAIFTATEGAKVTINDTGNLKLTVTGQTFTCEETVLSATAPAASFQSIKFNAEFEECKTALGTTATVTGFGQHGEGGACSFAVNASGTIDLVCPTGQEATFEAATCVVHIPPQKGLATLTYANSGSHVNVSFNVTKIKATHTDGFLCPFGSSGESSEAVLEGESLTAKPSTGTLVWEDGGPIFTATEGAKITIEDTGNLKFTVTGQTISCSQTLLTGTAPAASFPSIEFGAEWKECKTALGVATTITGFGQHGEEKPCKFMVNANGTVDLECPTGQEVKIDAATCVVHIPPQKGLGTLTYANSGSHVNVSLNVTKIKATHTDGFLCPFGSSGESSETVLEGESLTAKPSTGTLVWDENGPTFTATEGAKVTINDTGNLKLTVTGQAITCEETVLSATAPAASFTSIRFGAVYNKCKTSSGIETKITGFGQHGEEEACYYTANANGTLDLSCPTGQEATVDAGPCVVHIPAQNGLGTLTYANSGSHVNISFNVEKIKATHTDGFLCPFGSSGESSETVLEGEKLTAKPSTGTLVWEDGGPIFTATSGAKITINDNGNLKLTVTGQTFTCEETVLSATAPAASFASIEFGAEWKECKTAFSNATVTGFGQHGEKEACKLAVNANGTIDLVCPTGQEATFEAATCVVHIPPQKGLGTLTYANSGSHVNVSFNVQKIKATHTDGFLCPFGSSGESSETVLEGEKLTAKPSTGTLVWEEET